GKYTEAGKAAAELTKLAADSPEEYRLAAVILARCVPLAAKDAKLPEAERKKQSEDYASRAVQALRQAVERGDADLVQLKTASVFAPLRSRDDFQKLGAEVEKKLQK